MDFTPMDIKFITDLVLAGGILLCLGSIGMWVFAIIRAWHVRMTLKLEVARRRRMLTQRQAQQVLELRRNLRERVASAGGEEVQ